MEPVGSLSPSGCCSTVLFRSSSWELKLLFVALGYYSICLQSPLHLLPGGVSLADLLPRLLSQLGVWTRAAPGSMGLFLSLETLPGCTLFIEELFFFGSRLCLTLLPPQWFPTGGNTTVDCLLGPDVAQWISMLDRRMLKPILDLLSLQPS